MAETRPTTKRQPSAEDIERILGDAVNTLNAAHALMLPIITLCDDITAESLSGQEAWHRAEACTALAEKAGRVIEDGLRALYSFPKGGAA